MGTHTVINGPADSAPQDEGIVVNPGQLSLPATSSESPGITVNPGELVVDPHELAPTPYDDKQATAVTPRLGVGPDNKPIYNVQAVPDDLRWKTQMLFDTAEEKASYLKKQLGDEWKIEIAPNQSSHAGDVMLQRKGSSHWGVVDPQGMSNDSLIKEGSENVFSLAQMLAIPANALSGALAAGGIEAVRQSLKTILDPDATMSAPSIIANTVGGGVSGGISEALGAGKNAAVKGLKDAAGKVSGALDPEAPAPSGLIPTLISKLNIVRTPKFIAQEVGATGENIEHLTNNISYLLKNHPEFEQALSSKFTTEGKYQALKELRDQTGEKLSEIYSNPNNTVKVNDVLRSDNMRLLDNAVSTREVAQGPKRIIVGRTAQTKAANIKRDFLDDLGTLVLGQDSPYMAAWRLKKLHTDTPLSSFNFKSNDEALVSLIGQEEVPIADLWAVQKGRTQQLNFDKKASKISSADTMLKYVTDAIGDANTEAVRKVGGDELAGFNKLYNNLSPVVRSIARKSNAQAAEKLNILKEIPGVMNGFKRGGLMLAQNILNRTEMRTAMRQFGGIGSLPTAGKSVVSTVMQKALRGGSFLEARQIARKQLLPRDADAYFDDPQLINSLNEKVGSSDNTDAMVQLYERGDKDGFANALSNVATEASDQFEVAPYKSLVVQDGKPIIQDKYDREAYRQHIEKTITDPKERYVALQALNGRNEMVKTPYDAPEKPLTVGPVKTNLDVKKPSAVSRVASSLKGFDTATLTDGTERVDYDY